MRRDIKILVTVIILAVFIYIIKKVGILGFYRKLANTNWIYILLAFLMMLLAFLIWNLRWKLILDKFVRVPFLKLLPISMSGIFVNNTTPGAGTGGEPIRAYFVAMIYKKSNTKIFGTTILDKLFNAVVFLVICLFSSLILFYLVDINIILRAALFTFLIILLASLAVIFMIKNRINAKFLYLNKILLFVYSSKIINFINRKFSSYKSFEWYVIKRINNVISVIKAGIRDRNTRNNSIIFAFFYWMTKYLSYYFVFLALGYNIRFAVLVIVLSLSQLVGDLSFLPGGIGMTEAVMIGLYNALNIELSVATLATVISRAIYYFYSVFIGYVCINYLHIKYH